MPDDIAAMEGAHVGSTPPEWVGRVRARARMHKDGADDAAEDLGIVHDTAAAKATPRRAFTALYRRGWS